MVRMEVWGEVVEYRMNRKLFLLNRSETLRQDMKTYSILVLFILLSILTSCDGVGAPLLPIIRPPENKLTWVAHLYIGGRQCNPRIKYDPPDVRVVLSKEDVYIFETMIEIYGTCEGCDCPQYAGMHYALILKINVVKAIELGFEEKDPPEY